jgi:hypothetical protein
MIQKYKKFTKLSSEEKKLFVEAYLILGIMRFAILTTSFKHLTRSMEHSTKKQVLPKLDEDQIYIAKRIGDAIVRASAHTPWQSACLVQALTAQKMLKKRCIGGAFYLGVFKERKDTGEIEAHAWAQCGELTITGGRGSEAYTVLSVFAWR